VAYFFVEVMCFSICLDDCQIMVWNSCTRMVLVLDIWGNFDDTLADKVFWQINFFPFYDSS